MKSRTEFTNTDAKCWQSLCACFCVWSTDCRTAACFPEQVAHQEDKEYDCLHQEVQLVRPVVHFYPSTHFLNWVVQPRGCTTEDSCSSAALGSECDAAFTSQGCCVLDWWVSLKAVRSLDGFAVRVGHESRMMRESLCHFLKWEPELASQTSFQVSVENLTNGFRVDLGLKDKAPTMHYGSTRTAEVHN